jgi:hypothetical protein
VELWGYYSAYDHVILCWLFGTMVELPKGMPMFTMDVKQFAMHYGNPKIDVPDKDLHNALADAKWTKAAWEFVVAWCREGNYNINLNPS